MNKFIFTVIQSLLLFDFTKQSHVNQVIKTVKAIGKTIKSPLFKQIGNTIKKPIIKTFGNTMKNSMNMFRRNKSTIKNIACGFQEKYVRTSHNFGSKSVKYLGGEVIKKFKYMKPQAAKGCNQLARTQGKQNIQMRSAAAQIGGKGLRPMVKISSEYLRGKELGSLINMVSKSKPQYPFVFAIGGLNMFEDFKRVSKNEYFAKKLTHGFREEKPIDPSEEITKKVGYFPKASDQSEFSPYQLDERPQEPVTEPVQNECKGTDSAPEKTNMYQVPEKYKDCEKISFGDGRQFAGDVVDGKMHGKGHLFFEEGVTYEGDFVGGKMCGNGKFIYPKGESYTGFFVNDIAHGKGVLEQLDGVSYEGDFRDGAKHGQGKLTYSNGDIYEGGFVKGYESGKGKLTRAQSTKENLNKNVNREADENRYEKEFVDGTIYEGGFNDGNIEGKGNATYPNGNSYKGGWWNQRKNGYGEYFWANGDWYKGHWRNGLHDGLGEKYIKADDEARKYVWREGKEQRFVNN